MRRPLLGLAAWSLALGLRRWRPARRGAERGCALRTGLGASSPRPRSRRRATPSRARATRPRAGTTVTVPNTVVGALVENGTYPDPYFGMNLRKIPGTSYPIGERFTLLPMPADSPFKPAWWYRKEFELPAALVGPDAVWLHFDGINYRANIWVNGTRIAGADEVAGAFRRYEFDVTRLARPGEPNVVAVEVFGPGAAATSRSCGWTGTRRRPTRTWACGATCT